MLSRSSTEGDGESPSTASIRSWRVGAGVTRQPYVDGSYWIIDDLGNVYPRGDAKALGVVDRSLLAGTEVVTSLSATATGDGYWIFTSLGRVVPFGDATFYGDMRDTKLQLR